MPKPIKIGTRASILALWQANWVKTELEKRHGLAVELVKIKTTGDKITDVPLAKVGGKGLFVKEIEESLLAGETDLAVHSMKDVPTIFPQGLHLKAITKREDARDALISRDGKRLSELPKGAKIGTSSLRRQSQLLHMRPDFNIVQLRGNLDTRLKKLSQGMFDAIILAGAGIKRLGWADKITQYLEHEIMLPAIGQGALGIETRSGDGYINSIAGFFNHDETSLAVRAERAMLKTLEGGCQVPIAAYAAIEDDTLKLTGLVASIDGATVIKAYMEGKKESAEDIGIRLAQRLLGMGADKILDELYGRKTLIERMNSSEV